MVDFVMMPHIDSFEIFLFVLQFYLFVAQLFPESFFLLVQMQEYLYVAIELCLLLVLDDLLYISLLGHLLFFLGQQQTIFFIDLMLHLFLQLSELLSLLLDVLMHSQFHLIQVLFVYLPRFPKCQSLLCFGCSTFAFSSLSCFQLYLLTVHQSFFHIVSDCEMDQLLVQEHSFESIVISHFILILVCAQETSMLLALLDSDN